MKHPLQLTVRNVRLSEAARTEIQEKAAKLETVDQRIIGCRVSVDKPHKHHQHGSQYSVRIDLTIPGAELVIKRESAEDVYVAIHKAFDAARRRLRDHNRRRTIDAVVPREEVRPHARVSRIFPDSDYGFLETADGREVYFHRNSVQHGGFDRLRVGMEVRYVESEGDNGPQASVVVHTGRYPTPTDSNEHASVL